MSPALPGDRTDLPRTRGARAETTGCDSVPRETLRASAQRGRERIRLGVTGENGPLLVSTGEPFGAGIRVFLCVQDVEQEPHLQEIKR